MKVVKIYESEGDNKEVIYLLENDRKIIQRSNATISKFNLSKWDEINFIPTGFQEVARGLSVEEEEGLRIFSFGRISSIWKRIKKWFSRFTNK